jgi:microcystin-dependent protein
MPTFTFTETYADGNPLFELDLDNLRNSIETAVNSTGFDFVNIAPTSINSVSFDDPSIFAQPGTAFPFAGTAAPMGWLLMQGQSVLVATYPNLFAAIGYTYGGSGTTFNLPNKQGYLSLGADNLGNNGAAGNITTGVSGGTPTVLGSTIGNQDIPIHNHTGSIIITPSGEGEHTITVAGSHTHTADDQGFTGGGASGSLPVGRTGNFESVYGLRAATESPTGVTVTTNTGLHTHTVTAISLDNNNPTSGIANGVVQPTIILNYIIKT